jgi:hypothetical protein
MAVMLSALRACRVVSIGRLLVMICVSGLVSFGVTVGLEGLGQLRNALTSIFEAVTFRLVTYPVMQLLYRVPQTSDLVVCRLLGCFAS